ncbi:hypothetical protein GCM10027203_44180 [Nonomuraea fastidiosa]
MAPAAKTAAATSVATVVSRALIERGSSRTENAPIRIERGTSGTSRTAIPSHPSTFTVSDFTLR